MKKYKPILIVSGEPNSIFIEILFKSIKKIKTKNPIILICSEKLISMQMKKLKMKFEFNKIDKKINNKKLQIKNINLINVDYKPTKAFNKISTHSNNYINNCFEIAFEILKKYKFKKFINGPINKNTFLRKRFLGITEFMSNKFKKNKTAMLIYNKKLSVCPLTTHLPIKLVPNSISKKKLEEKIFLIDQFYKKNLGFKPHIAITGLNPHCESILEENEDERIIIPTVKKLKNKYNVDGPYSADTIFMTNNRQKFHVIIGMYHDQVLAPMKTIFEYDAINITLGLPFIRISPDHGPNEKMVGLNKSNPKSLIEAIKFLDKN